MAEYVVSLPQQGRRTRLTWRMQSGWFALFLICSLLVFVVFSHYFPLLSGGSDLVGRIVTTLLFMVGAFLIWRPRPLRPAWQVLLAFGTACAAISLDYLVGLSQWLLPALRIGANTPAGWAIDKLESSLLSIAVVLCLTACSRQRLSSLCLRRGNLRLGLSFGLMAMLLLSATAIPVAELLFLGRDLSVERVLPWAPWVLVFVLANAFNEELLFRGLFLGRLQPFLGKFAANLLMAIPFTLMHTGVDYSSDLLPFQSITFALSLIWGWLVQKSGTLWGSVLFHAAADIPVVLAIFSRR